MNEVFFKPAKPNELLQEGNIRYCYFCCTYISCEKNASFALQVISSDIQATSLSLRVRSSTPQVTSSNLRVTSLIHMLKVQIHELRVQMYEL